MRRDGQVAVSVGVARTEFDDGAVRQAVTSHQPALRRTCRISVTRTDMPDFLGWLVENGIGFFDFIDPHDSVVRSARIVGGADAVEFGAAASDTRLRGDRYYQAEITLEGDFV